MPSRYAAGGGHRLPAVALVLGLHAALAAMLLQHSGIIAKKRVESLEMVDLSLKAPPPAPQAGAPPPPVAAAVVAPPRAVEIPAPSLPPIAVTQVSAPMVLPSIAASVMEAPPGAAMPSASTGQTPTVDGGDMGTRMVDARPPKYPIESRRRREQGVVVLAITLGTDGRVSALAVARSSGFARLDDAARNAVRHWRWSPTLRDGQPVMVRGTVEIPFVLAG